MNLLRRINVLLSLFLLLSLTVVKAQHDPYRAEIGVQLGTNVYFGDLNTVAYPGGLISNMKNMTGDAGAMFRYRFNKRLALRAGYDYSGVKGSYMFKEGDNLHTLTLNNSLHLFDLWGEFNFFDLENNPHKRFSKRYSPFIFAGAGGVVSPDYRSSEGSHFAFAIPFGVGFKAKLTERLNFNIQLTNRVLLSDGLEALQEWDNPPPHTLANPMNNDMLSGLSIGLSYDFWTRCDDCRQSTFSEGKKPAPQKIKRQPEKKERKRR